MFDLKLIKTNLAVFFKCVLMTKLHWAPYYLFVIPFSIYLFYFWFCFHLHVHLRRLAVIYVFQIVLFMSWAQIKYTLRIWPIQWQWSKSLHSKKKKKFATPICDFSICLYFLTNRNWVICLHFHYIPKYLKLSWCCCLLFLFFIISIEW